MSIVDAVQMRYGSKSYPRAGAILILAASLVLVAVYYRPLAFLSNYWDQPEYSHGYLIPIIAFLLGWHNLTRLRPSPGISWSGIGFLILGLTFLIAGQLSTFNPGSLYGFIIALIGLTLSFAGWPVTRALMPAFGMLFFAIPLPNAIYVDASARMQLVSSSLGSGILEALGMPVYQEGNVIDLGVMKLEVAEACSGLRYLFPLASFGYLAAYLLDDLWWKRAIVLISVLPIAIVINAARIALIGISVNLWGQSMATGVLHYSEGFAAFLVCGGLLLIEIWLLLRIGGHRGRFRLDYFGPAKGPVLSKPIPVRAPGVLVLVLLLVLGTAADAAINKLQVVPAVRPNARALSEAVPLSLGGWYGAPLTLQPDVLAALKLTDYFLAEYHHGVSEAPVALYLAYYASQSVGAESHSPAYCIPGSGWEIVSRSVVTIPARAGHPAQSVNRFRIRHGAEEQLVYYWFNERGRTVSSPWGFKWNLLKDQLLTGRSDGYLVRLTTPFVAERASESDERLIRFLGQFDEGFSF